MQPVPIALAATVFGLSLAPIYCVPPVSGWLFVVFSGLLFFLLRKNSKAALVFLFIVFFLFSNLRYPHQFPTRQDIIQIDNLARKVTLTGTLTNVSQLTGGRSRIDLLVDSIAQKKQTIPLLSTLRVRLYLEEGSDQLLPGDLVHFRSRLRQPRLFGTPGEFNWPRYLASQHIDMTAWVKNSEQVEILGQQVSFSRRKIVRWRSNVATTIQQIMPESRAYLVRALVLGEGRVIPDHVRKILAKSGISHLFAISGLHLGMIALLGYRLFLGIYRRFPALLNWQPPQRVLPLVLLPLLLGYLLLTGDAVSTRRAFFLAALGTVFLLWRHYVNPLLLLASLALLSLLINPLLLWQAGWQLSFAGAAGILLWRPLWQNRVNNLPSYLRYPSQLFLVTFAAMLATLPLVLFNFHLFAPVGVLANLVCVPVVTLLALPIGFIGLMLYSLLPQLAEMLFLLCGYLLELLTSLAGWMTEIPGLGGNYLFLSRGQYLAVGLLVLPILLFVWLQKQSLRVMVTTISLCAALILWQFTLAETTPVSLTMFSVGQGESLLLRNNDGQAILVDGGGLYSKRFDVGERLLAPAFGELGVTQLDAVFLTHDHPDHRKGLVFVLNHFPVREFWTGHQFAELHPDLQEALIKNDIPLRTVDSGWSQLTLWNSGDLNVFYGATSASSENDSSLAIYLRTEANDGLLLTGDLERRGVLKLLDAGLPGPVSLLKLPHHGSKFSATERLINQINPMVCLVSVGYQNRYHLPARQIVNFLQETEIPLYRTDLSGTVHARLTNSGWQVKHWERGLFR